MLWLTYEMRPFTAQTQFTSPNINLQNDDR